MCVLDIKAEFLLDGKLQLKLTLLACFIVGAKSTHWPVTGN